MRPITRIANAEPQIGGGYLARVFQLGVRAVRSEYTCLKCSRPFLIEITDAEAASSLDRARTQQCPHCSQRVGIGPVRCRKCGQTFDLELPHWHVSCNLAKGNCPACAFPYVSLCIC